MQNSLNTDGQGVHQYQLNVLKFHECFMKRIKEDRKTMFSCNIGNYSLEIILFKKRKYIFVYNIKYISEQFSINIKSP